MNYLHMAFKMCYMTKTFFINVALMWFHFFMNTFNVPLYSSLLVSRILTQISFVFLLVFMNHLKMPFKIFFLTKSLLTYVAMMWFDFIMNTLNVPFYSKVLVSRIFTQITLYFLLFSWTNWICCWRVEFNPKSFLQTLRWNYFIVKCIQSLCFSRPALLPNILKQETH